MEVKLILTSYMNFSKTDIVVVKWTFVTSDYKKTGKAQFIEYTQEKGS